MKNVRYRSEMKGDVSWSVMDKRSHSALSMRSSSQLTNSFTALLDPLLRYWQQEVAHQMLRRSGCPNYPQPLDQLGYTYAALTTRP